MVPRPELVETGLLRAPRPRASSASSVIGRTACSRRGGGRRWCRCRSSGVTRRVPAGSEAETSENGITRVVGTGAVSVRTQRKMTGPALCPAVSSQLAIPGSSRSDDGAHDPVVVHLRLVPVEAALVPPVVDRLPPGVAQREAPVQALRRRDLHEEGLVRAQLPGPDHGPVLGRSAHGGPVEGREEGVGGVRPRELQEEIEVGDDEVTQRDQLAGDDRPWVLRRGAPPSPVVAPMRSMDREDATSVSQS